MTPLSQDFLKPHARLSLVALILQGILTLTVGHDGDIGGADHDTGSATFSIKGATAAFFGFSWTGVVMIINGAPVWAACLVGVIVGLLFCVGYLAAMRSLIHLQSDGIFKIESTIGLVELAKQAGVELPEILGRPMETNPVEEAATTVAADTRAAKP